MIVQFNTGHNVVGGEKLSEPLTLLIADELERFSAHITRVEVHLSDEDGNKNGQNDKRCMLEARMEGRQPIAVTNKDNSYQMAVEGAITKLISSLETITGHSRNR